MQINRQEDLVGKRHIGIFCGSLYRAGAERITIYLADGLKKKGYQTEIITCSRQENEYEEPKGVKRHILVNKENSNYMYIIQRLRNIVKDNNIDTLLVISTPLCVYAIPAIVGLNVKVVVSERNDPSHFSGKSVTKYFSRFLMKRADGFVFQTHDAKEYYRKQLKGRGTVICNSLFIENLPAPYIGQREKEIVSVGRLTGQKNHAMLIEAFSECFETNTGFKLSIYGEGELRQELESLVDKLNMQGKIQLHGNVHNVCERIRTVTLFVLPSNYEGMPNALIEAMAVGLPCISTDCPIGGPSELIENGVNGMLVPVGDKEKLKEVMKYVLNSGKLRRNLAENAVMIREKLSENKILEAWIEYIERI